MRIYSKIVHYNTKQKRVVHNKSEIVHYNTIQKQPSIKQKGNSTLQKLFSTILSVNSTQQKLNSTLQYNTKQKHLV